MGHDKLSTCGAEAWPVSHAGRDGRRSLETIVVMSEHADGRGAVHLTADQALYVQSRLSQIAVTFLLTIGNGVHPHRQATTHPDGPAVHIGVVRSGGVACSRRGRGDTA